MVQALPRVDLETADALRAQHAADEDAAPSPHATTTVAQQPPPRSAPTAVAAATSNRGLVGGLHAPMLRAAMLGVLRGGRRGTSKERGAGLRVWASGGQPGGARAAVLPADCVDGQPASFEQPNGQHQAVAALQNGNALQGIEAADGVPLDRETVSHEAAQQPQPEGSLVRPTPASSKATVRTAHSIMVPAV